MKQPKTLIFYPDRDGQYRIKEATPREPEWVKQARSIVVLCFFVAVFGGCWWLWVLT